MMVRGTGYSPDKSSMKRVLIRVLLAGLLGMLMVGNAWTAIDANVLYQKHCAECHGADRLGKVGPAPVAAESETAEKKGCLQCDPGIPAPPRRCLPSGRS